MSLKREVVAWEWVGGGGSSNKMHKEFNKGKHPGVQPFTVLQGSMARWVWGREAAWRHVGGQVGPKWCVCVCVWWSWRWGVGVGACVGECGVEGRRGLLLRAHVASPQPYGQAWAAYRLPS